MARKSMEHHGTMDENNEDEMETGDALGFFLESDLLHFFFTIMPLRNLNKWQF